MSNTVKIVRFHKTGPAEVLQFDELPLPEPGPGEIRLRVKALGLNRAEIMFRNGQYLEPRPSIKERLRGRRDRRSRRHRGKPVLDKTFCFTEITEAHR